MSVSHSNEAARFTVVARLVALIALAMACGAGCQRQESAESVTPTAVSQADASPQMETPSDGDAQASSSGTGIPRLVDLGAGKCIPCKMMAPILEELREEYEGKLEVVFIDVWENSQAGKEYGIQMIPTQIFYDASGKELFRHEGFFSKEDILKKWQGFGVSLEN